MPITAAAEWEAGWLLTFDPVAYDSTPQPSVALLVEHQLPLRETYLLFYRQHYPRRSLGTSPC